MDLKRIKKAIVAGLLAWAGAVVTAAVEGGTPVSAEGWLALVGGAAAVGIGTAFAVYKARNVGAGLNDAGSEPAHDLGDVASGTLPVYRPGQYPRGSDRQG